MLVIPRENKPQLVKAKCAKHGAFRRFYCPVAWRASDLNTVSPPTSQRSPVGKTAPPFKKSFRDLYTGSGLGTTAQLVPSQCNTSVDERPVEMSIDVP
jgi:hypothetical protein